MVGFDLGGGNGYAVFDPRARLKLCGFWGRRGLSRWTRLLPAVKLAKRMNVTPETARDMILQGTAHAGIIDPELAAAMAAAAGGGLLGANYLRGD